MTGLLPPSLRNLAAREAAGLSWSRLTWRQRFQAGSRGLKRGFRGQSSFFVNFFYGALAFAAAIVLRCDLVEWSVLIVCFALVLITELFNSALQTMVNALGEPARSRARACLETSGAAILAAEFTAAIIGCLVFVHRIFVLFE
jgi:diacylglycerol kinase